MVAVLPTPSSSPGLKLEIKPNSALKDKMASFGNDIKSM
jgi:hypothetical protein